MKVIRTFRLGEINGHIGEIHSDDCDVVARLFKNIPVDLPYSEEIKILAGPIYDISAAEFLFIHKMRGYVATSLYQISPNSLCIFIGEFDTGNIHEKNVARDIATIEEYLLMKKTDWALQILQWIKTYRQRESLYGAKMFSLFPWKLFRKIFKKPD